jgi:Ca2+-binding RTX toxin-like protein
MLSGTALRVQTFAPNLSSPISEVASGTISDEAVEIGNIADVDIPLDGIRTVSTSFDVTGATLTARFLDNVTGRFLDVDDATGFNGWVVGFDGLGGPGMRLNAVDLSADTTMPVLSQEDIGWTRDSLSINVDGLLFAFNVRIVLTLGFAIRGTDDGDDIAGAEGRDALAGRAGDDLLAGNGGRDRLDGGVGDDTLVGGTGRDRLTGGEGSDTFVLRAGGGSDRVTDFDPAADLIRVFRLADGVDDLTLTDRDGGVEVSAGRAALFLAGVAAADLTEDHFLF